MDEYNFREIEKKWQNKWYTNNSFKAIDFHPTKPKYYALYEFPNVSGNLHMGHLKASVPTDALARYKRFKGYNVLFPIGGDAFGLPAENAAMKTGIDPHDFVANGFKNISDQFKTLGISFDFDRAFCSSDEDYYKWTQWIFLQLFKHGKAYKSMGTVNYCPNCKTVLSNEDSQGGKCDRCGGEVIQKTREVWYLKMKEYAEKLLDNVDHIDMAESLKNAQRHWIGRSEGMKVKFKVVDAFDNYLQDLEIFTTCIETIYGVTYLLVAPEHSIIDKYSDKITNIQDVMEYRKKTALKKELDRKADTKEKTGVKIDGLFVINPINNKKFPLYAADFILINYGTGAAMAVACHDQRDYEFAKLFNIPFLQVIEGDVTEHAVEKGEYISKNSKMLNSEEFTGLPVKEAKKKIADKLEQMGVGTKMVNYNIDDWAFNRQRYWAEPFPVVICDHCGIVPMNEKDLPLVLPKVKDYMPAEDGSSPLAKATDWVKCTCPKCGRPARHDTDTMPNWAGSSWYWLRHTDPHNDKAFADYEKLKYWGQVDCYTGGIEHITRHVLYAWFWQNFLYEIGAVPTRDPFAKKMGSGLILDDEGKKMSKSSKNGVSPMVIIDKYGADIARLHTMFLGSYEDNNPWTFDGINGITTFVNRVWALQDMIKGEDISKEHIFDINRLTKKVGEDIEDLKLNTCISAFMIFIKKVRDDKFITREELRRFLILLNPIAPHITSEIFERVFNRDIMEDAWPEYDEKYLVEDTIEIPVQINGKLNKVVKVKKDITQAELVDILPSLVQFDFDINLAKKIIFVPNKIVNIIK